MFFLTMSESQSLALIKKICNVIVKSFYNAHFLIKISSVYFNEKENFIIKFKFHY